MLAISIHRQPNTRSDLVLKLKDWIYTSNALNGIPGMVFNLLNMKRDLLYIRNQPVPRS